MSVAQSILYSPTPSVAGEQSNEQSNEHSSDHTRTTSHYDSSLRDATFGSPRASVSATTHCDGDALSDPRWSLATTEFGAGWEALPEAFISLSVVDYEKHDMSGISKSFATYGIVTKTNWPVFRSQEFTVRRRYKDFAWLRVQMQKAFPTTFIPPLPEKNVSGYFDRFSPEFLGKRKRMLERFLQKVSQHPKLRLFPDFHIFLEAKSWALETLKVSRDDAQAEPSDTKSPLRNPKIKSQDERFEHLHTYVNEFEIRVIQLEKFCHTMQKSKKDLSQSMFDLGAMLVLFSNTEIELSESISRTGEIFEQAGHCLEKEVRDDEEAFAEPLHHYVLYLQAIQMAIKKRDAAYVRLEELENELASRKPVLPPASVEKPDGGAADGQDVPSTHEVTSPTRRTPSFLARFQRSPSVTDADVSVASPRAAKDAEQIAQLELAIQQGKIEQERMDACILEEYKHFQRIKVADFKAILQTYCKSQIAHHKEATDAWEKLGPLLEKIQISNEK